jgi:hypothetical protein
MSHAPVAIPAKAPAETDSLPVVKFAARIHVTAPTSRQGMLITEDFVRALSARSHSEGRTEQ